MLNSSSIMMTSLMLHSISVVGETVWFLLRPLLLIPRPGCERDALLESSAVAPLFSNTMLVQNCCETSASLPKGRRDSKILLCGTAENAPAGFIPLTHLVQFRLKTYYTYLLSTRLPVYRVFGTKIEEIQPQTPPIKHCLFGRVQIFCCANGVYVRKTMKEENDLDVAACRSRWT